MDSVVVEEPVETQEETDQFADIETEAPQPEEQPQEVELPNKFKGKSMEDIVSSYENLEKELGRKGQEIGELRKLTDGILQQQLTTSHSGTEVQEEETDFFDDPDRAVNKAIESHPKFREFEEHQKVQAASATTQQLQNEHPDYLEVVGDPKFQEWVQASPIRTQLYVSAHNYDINSARELIGNWKERSLISNTSEAEANKVTKRNQALKAGKGVSRTSSESTAGKKIYRRADLIRLRTQQPERYEALQDEILRAYADGRVK
jgi:hypothetical protein|tara:strand:- start:2430 stop:3215 length:786 start_codon:yes stop_codon:yes gene_type:complete